MTRVSPGRLISLIMLILVMVAFGVPAQAQDATDDTAEEPESELAVMVGEITVTAQKRSQDIQEVPISVSTLQGEDLEVITAGGVDVLGLSARVPSLIMESSFGRAFPRFYIRGLGNTDFDLNASQPVSMVVDDVVLENPILKGMPLFDIDQVEVMRGPQGTLFGRNTPAGVVKFASRRPTRELDVFARASLGTYDTTDLKFGVGGPLSKTLSARASGLYQYRNDWIDNEHTGEKNALGGYDTKAYRLQLLWEPSDAFDALVNVHGWDIDGTARVFRANIIQHGTNRIIDGFDQSKVWQDGLNQQDIKSWGGSLNMNWDFGPATLTSITGYETLEMYSRGDIDGGYGAAFLGPGNYGPGYIPFPSESADGLPYLDQWTEELRLASDGVNTWNWLVGAYYFSEKLQADTFSYDSLSPGNPQDGYSFQKQDATAYALFGSVDWRLTDRWNLVAGLRFSHDEKDFSAERPDPTFQTPTVAPIIRNTDADVVTWDLSTTYKLHPNFNIYGRVATGYRAPSIQGRILFCADFEGGLNPATNCVTVADTEKILSVEAGIKTILADNRLRFNLTGYAYELDGQQVTAVGGQFNTATLLNVDKTKGYGLETDIEWTPTGHLFMTLGASYNPTEIDDPNLTVAPCGGGCTVLDPVIGGLAYVDGNSLPHAPDLIFNGIVNWQSNVVTKGIFASVDWAYYSEKQFFLYESEEFKADSFEVGLRLGYAWSTKGEIALFGRNITNEEIVQNGIDFDNLTGMTNDPIIVGVEFVGRF